MDIPVSEQWRPWSDAAFCDVWSGSALFGYVPKKGRLMHSCVFFYVSFPNILILIDWLIDRINRSKDRQKKYMSVTISCFILLEKLEKTYLSVWNVSRLKKHTIMYKRDQQAKRKKRPTWTIVQKFNIPSCFLLADNTPDRSITWCVESK